MVCSQLSQLQGFHPLPGLVLKYRQVRDGSKVLLPTHYQLICCMFCPMSSYARSKLPILMVCCPAYLRSVRLVCSMCVCLCVWFMNFLFTGHSETLLVRMEHFTHTHTLSHTHTQTHTHTHTHTHKHTHTSAHRQAFRKVVVVRVQQMFIIPIWVQEI